MQISIIRHVAERTRLSGSARMIAMSLSPVSIIDYGVKDQPVAKLEIPRRHEPGTFLLFPEGEARDEVPELRHLIVLDASWSQARRMRHRIDTLRGIPTLHVSIPSRPRLRQPPRSGQGSTIEAVAAALAAANDPSSAAALLDTYDAYVGAMRYNQE